MYISGEHYYAIIGTHGVSIFTSNDEAVKVITKDVAIELLTILEKVYEGTVHIEEGTERVRQEDTEEV